MINIIKDYIKQNKLIAEGDRIVVGVSGGADSICLLHVLSMLKKEYLFSLSVVHIHHGIRAREADEDEQFVKELCNKMQLPFEVFHYNVKEYAKQQGLSEEEAGRKVRYASFLEVCKRNNCNKIAVAHNMNDNAETVLFHLFRGSSLRGLAGIEPMRVVETEFGIVSIIRPLLCIERKEIEGYLTEITNSPSVAETFFEKTDSFELPYRIDSTNLTDDYSRNKIRNKILTYATAEINQNTIGNIAEAATQLREIEAYMSAQIALRFNALVINNHNEYIISVDDLLQEPLVLQKGILMKLLELLAGKRKDLEAKHVNAVLELAEKQVGRYIHLPYQIIAEREYKNIKLFLDQEQSNKSLHLAEPIQVSIPGIVFTGKEQYFLEAKLFDYKKSDSIPKSSCEKWFDYDKIENAVEIRTRKEGDYIQINHSGGHKKLKDYFIDQKIPKQMRDSQLLITDGNHVMWLLGEDRMSEKYKVEDSTSKVLLMKLINLEEKTDDR